jgi:hypothetical protein
MTSHSHHESIRRKAEDYATSVHALLSFAACVVHDGTSLLSGSTFGIGRRMTKTTGDEVTPDLVAQKSGAYGVVAEIKKSLPADREKWSRTVSQLRKYDDDLTGWWTSGERLEQSDTIALISQERGRAFARVLSESKAAAAESVGEHTAVVEFNRSPEVDTFIFFRLESGIIRDSELAAKLDEGKKIPLDRVLRTFPSIAFYDARPPVEMLLSLLWTDIFLPMSVGRDRDEKIKAIPLEVNVSDLTEELQKAFGSGALSKDHRSAEFPKKAWIADAMDTLVQIRLAAARKAREEYTVFFRIFKEDVLERFCNSTASKGPEASQALDDSGQLLLLAAEEDEGS